MPKLSHFTFINQINVFKVELLYNYRILWGSQYHLLHTNRTLIPAKKIQSYSEGLAGDGCEDWKKCFFFSFFVVVVSPCKRGVESCQLPGDFLLEGRGTRTDELSCSARGRALFTQPRNLPRVRGRACPMLGRPQLPSSGRQRAGHPMWGLLEGMTTQLPRCAGSSKSPRLSEPQVPYMYGGSTIAP